MSDPTRRRLLFSLPFAALPTSALASMLPNLWRGFAAAPPQDAIHSATAPVDGKAQGKGGGIQDGPGNFKTTSQNDLHPDFSRCTAFPFGSLPLRFSDAGAPTHDILRGTIPSGELVELHETTVAPGKMPHPAHQHPHVEFILIREGTIDFLYGGESHLLTPGGVGYTAPNELHGFRNSGSIPATYFIFSLGKR